MGSPEDKKKHRERRVRVRSEYAKSLEDKKFRQRRVEDKRKIDVKKLSHKEFVDLIQELDEQ